MPGMSSIDKKESGEMLWGETSGLFARHWLSQGCCRSSPARAVWQRGVLKQAC